jgi:hypothetical protein
VLSLRYTYLRGQFAIPLRHLLFTDLILSTTCMLLWLTSTHWLVYSEDPDASIGTSNFLAMAAALLSAVQLCVAIRAIQATLSSNSDEYQQLQLK